MLSMSIDGRCQMEITVEHTPLGELVVTLRGRAEDEDLARALALLQTGGERLCALDAERRSVLLEPGEVLYAESVEERTYLYCAEAVLQTLLTLAELEARYEGLGYCRVSKAMVVNLRRIRSLRSRPGGRIEATVENGERIMISRHYAPLLRERLGLKGEK